MRIDTPAPLENGVLGINQEITIDAALPDIAYQIPARLSALTFSALIDGVGEYEVLTTTDTPATVAAGLTVAGWFSLGGSRTASAQVTIPARMRYIRFVRVSGTIKISFYAS